MSNIIQIFSNPYPDREYEITFRMPSFLTSCPNQSFPEQAQLEICYIPNEVCIESDSLKNYWNSFKDKGIYYENTINQIYNEIKQICNPRFLRVQGEFSIESGVETKLVVESKHFSDK